MRRRESPRGKRVIARQGVGCQDGAMTILDQNIDLFDTSVNIHPARASGEVADA